MWCWARPSVSDAVVTFDGVWKKFRRGERHDSLRDLVPSLFRRAVGRARREASEGLHDQEFWALKGVSFEVKRGEALGIIGPNGAGKSTTLKLLNKILKPTRGACSVRGRVGALIEIAAGFHPDLTGRENIYLQGAIIGMKRREIAAKLDRIVDFAGVSDFIDTPVKRYSSGMNARLGFAIAAHLDPDVLLIDEVLGVGDMAFQAKCVDRMKEFAAQGVAIVFVSHNLQAVANLCPNAVLMEAGQVAAAGDSQSVLSQFVRAVNQQRSAADADAPCRILDAALTDSLRQPVAVTAPGDMLRLRATYCARETVDDLTFGFFLYRSTDQLLVYDGNIDGRELGLRGLPAGKEVVVEFTFRTHLTRGQYHLGLHVFHNPTHRFLARLVPAGLFGVAETRSSAGVSDLELTVKQIGQDGPRLAVQQLRVVG
jgi:lipopolysaccharide transport system ATP-binding protein